MLKASPMVTPRQPIEHKSTKAGLKEGVTRNTTGAKGGKQPVDEEDAFGGAERARKGKPVSLKDAKP